MQLDEPPQDPFEPIAIVGLGAILPDSDDADAFWQNVINANVSIGNIPDDRWVVSDHWQEGGPKNIPEGKTYSRIGAFVKGFEFDWKRWRVPPGTLSQIDLSQQWAVAVSAAALEDAGYFGDAATRKIPNSRTGVVFANALGGENRNLSNHRVWADSFARKAVEAGMPEDSVSDFKESLTDGLPRVDEDTMPGELANVVAGRVANLLDLQGPNYATDAACASTFAAVLDSCRLLQSRQVDLMIAGASDRTMDPATYAKFSAIGALSSSHSTPFDSGANGFVMGEGATAFVLKRLDDAIVDEDRVYAVIRGVGASSDGRGKGITAPSTRGQIQALARAYQQAGYGPNSVELIEAHGTSTVVGDATELTSLAEIFGDNAQVGSVAVGSIKSQIGHLKAAAGGAGLLKASFALHHRTIPPSAGFSEPNQSLDWEKIPFFIPVQARDWPKPKSHPRRASVSAFGFGGTNFHCALEQFDLDFHSSLVSEWKLRRDAYLMRPKAGFSENVLNSVLKKYGIQDKEGFLSHASNFDADENDYLNRSELIAAADTFSKHDTGMDWEELKSIEGGLLLLNADDSTTLRESIISIRSELFDGSPNFDSNPNGKRLSAELPKISNNFEPKGIRLAIAANTWTVLDKRIKMAIDSLDDPSKWEFLSKQFIFISDSTINQNHLLAHMYPGQGSQYVGMTHDLSKRFRIIGDTWREADVVMHDIIGEPLSEFVLRSNMTEEENSVAEEKLKQTEYTQPAMLTADLAIERLLNQHGIHPDMVAGHSLGEYAALMVSGILRFEDALQAAAARGTEMGNVEVPDKGIMASITAPYDVIESVLSSIDGYVIAANKNSPNMTVIAGETEPMQEAMARFQDEGATVVQLQTSHAFHSRIVAPANEPLRRFLEGLEISLPSIPITANVDGSFYPNTVNDGQDIKEAILEKLAPQMSSAVEWTLQVEAMRDAGAKIYLEVGPKRALALFAGQILDEESLVSITNHPKSGGITSFLGALGMLAVAGRCPVNHSLSSEIHTAEFQAGPVESSSRIIRNSSSVEEALRIRSRPLPNEIVSPLTQTESEIVSVSKSAKIESDFQANRRISTSVAEIFAQHVGFPASVLIGAISLNEIGLDSESRSAIVREIQSRFQVSPLDHSSFTTIQDFTDWIEVIPQVRESNHISTASESISSDPPVVSGVSLGLPGLTEVFDSEGWEAILSGRNLISELPEELKEKLLSKRIVRLVKEEDGTANLVPADSVETIPQLAGRGGHFDLSEQYGIDAHLVDAFDIATSLSFAAGLEALSDAGLPLIPVEQTNSAGKRMIRRWSLPDEEKDRTGVIFASVFPGLQKAIDHALNNGQVSNGHFDRKYLLQVLSMGHSQFANWIGARGPNLAINNACASTPAAFAIAEDWMATNRCDRVIIVSGDDSTGDSLMPWIGAGFAAAGAHAMGNEVEQVALPFDARRHGMLLGMGGAAFVLERHKDARERGVTPYVEVLGAEIANSAFHPTRLDTEHAAQVMERFVSRMEKKWNLKRENLVDDMTFMSHEPYTPPRGGSASAEVSSLRSVFGEGASRILITNGKGYTGHPMGVGLEDAIVIRGLAAGRLPPIANFSEPDPSLGTLNLCTGGKHDLSYALRHGAGFGSQIALTFLRRIALSDTARFIPGKIESWIKHHTGSTSIHLRLLDRKLVAYLDPDEDLIGGVQGEEVHLENKIESEPTSESIHNTALSLSEEDITIPEVQSTTLESLPIISEKIVDSDIEHGVLDVVSGATGYPSEFLELDADMEGELGIDSIKQAEIMAELRARYSLPVDDSFQLREYPTLGHVIGYISSFGNNSPVVPKSEPDEQKSQLSSDDENVVDLPPLAVEKTAYLSESVVDGVVSVVVDHTGYPAEFLEMDADMEGELGIDSIKQAEIMAELREQFSLPVDEEFQLRDHPTLGHVISYISSFSKSDEFLETVVDTISVEPELEVELSTDISASQPSIEGKLVTTQSKRYQIEVEQCEWSISKPLELEGRSLVVTDDAWGIAGTLCEALENKGIEAVRVFLDPSVTNGPIRERDGEVDVLRVAPDDEQQISELGDIVRSIAPPAGIIHLAPVRLAGVPWEDPTTSPHLDYSVTSLFGILKCLDVDLKAAPSGLVASVSALDGRHGIHGARFNSISAGAHGGVKSYGRERPNLRSRAIDLDPSLLSEPETLAEMLLTEIFEQESPRELAVDRDGTRYRLSLFEKELEDEISPLSSDDVWVVSGGAAGVTAACMIETAKKSEDAGARFILLGRSKLDPNQESLMNASDEILEQEKNALRERMMEEKEGKISLKEWNDQWSKWLRGLEIHKTLESIRLTGNEAIYLTVDVTDSESTREILRGVSENLGPVTGIVHGAGVEDSTPFENKEYSTMARVLSVKVDGWRNMVAALENDLPNMRFLCSFTSIAGRQGNAMQFGYCAANQILDVEMARIASHDEAPRAVAIAWAPWGDIGMATRGSLETIFERAGIDMIPSDQGASRFVDEALRGGNRMVMVSGSLGELDDESSTRLPSQPLPEEISDLISAPMSFPFVNRVESIEPYSKVVISSILDINSHLYLTDHAIDGIAYMPGVMAMEAFAEAARMMWPMCVIDGFEAVEFGLPVKVTKDSKSIRITASFERQDDNHIWIQCSLETDLINSKGEVFGESRSHHNGIVRMLKTGGLAERVKGIDLGQISSRSAIHGPKFVYDRMFHGPRFQVHGGVIGGIYVNEDRGLDSHALSRDELPRTDLFAEEVGGKQMRLESLPMLVEACFQNAGLVSMEIDGLESLPVGIEHVDIDVESFTTPLRIRSVRRSITDDGVTTHDAVIVNENDAVVIQLKGLRLKGMSSLTDEQRFTFTDV